MTLSSRDRKAILLGASALGLILVLRLVLIPWVGCWAQAWAGIASTRKVTGELQSKVRRLLLMRDRLGQTYGEAAGSALEDVETTRIALLEAVQKALGAGGLA